MTIPRVVHEPDLRMAVSQGVAQCAPMVNANRGLTMAADFRHAMIRPLSDASLPRRPSVQLRSGAGGAGCGRVGGAQTLPDLSPPLNGNNKQ
jgi:hypothetical protein